MKADDAARPCAGIACAEYAEPRMAFCYPCSVLSTNVMPDKIHRIDERRTTTPDRAIDAEFEDEEQHGNRVDEALLTEYQGRNVRPRGSGGHTKSKPKKRGGLKPGPRPEAEESRAEQIYTALSPQEKMKYTQLLGGKGNVSEGQRKLLEAAEQAFNGADDATIAATVRKALEMAARHRPRYERSCSGTRKIA